MPVEHFIGHEYALEEVIWETVKSEDRDLSRRDIYVEFRGESHPSEGMIGYFSPALEENSLKCEEPVKNTVRNYLNEILLLEDQEIVMQYKGEVLAEDRNYYRIDAV